MPSTDVHRSRSARRMRGVLTSALLAGACVVVGLAACAEESPNEFETTTGQGSTGAGAGSGVGGAGSGSGSGGLFEDGGLSAVIAITPKDPTFKVEVPLNGQTVPFQCIDASTGQPAVGATWELSNPEVGSIAATGVFTPNGLRVGDVDVTCRVGDVAASTTLNVIIHASDNAGGLTQTQIDILRGPPGGSDAGWKFLYPYDRTVFPRGILAPEIHLSQGSQASNAYYVHIVTPQYEYEGFFGTSGVNTQLQISQSAWEALTHAAGGQNVEVHVSKLYNGLKVGPIFRTWKLAAGKLHGTIYYNTYDSPLASNNGALMRIKGSSPTPEVLKGNCTVCHSVSADGSTAAAANHDGSGGTFDLSGGQLDPPNLWVDSERAAFAALYPKDGEVLVVHGAPGMNTPGTGGIWTSELRTRNGTLIPNSGIESHYAMTPVFAHDGSMLAFLDRSAQEPYPGTLSLMRYDALTQKFSAYEVLSTPAAGRHQSWPAFTPDGKYVVYQDGTGADLVTWSGNTGKIFSVDIATKQKTFLARLNGDGYMPAGARDENKNYEPTIAPIASGGYFWVMFTSRRTYGNKLTGSEFETKRLWVSAYDVNAAPGEDPSHPAFYIAGQELTSGNSRGFWALDPCKQDGAGCESGDECCNGYCNPTGQPPQFLCGPPDGECSDEFETCASAADCCDPELECIGNKCTLVPPE